MAEIKRGKKSYPLGPEIANAICDAMNLGNNIFSLDLEFNWLTKTFVAHVGFYPTDEQGNLIAEVLKEKIGDKELEQFTSVEGQP